MIKIVSIDSSSRDKPIHVDIAEFCREASNEGLDASVNMTINGWSLNDSCLLYLLYYEKRFDQNGHFFLAYDYKKIVAVGGVYISDFDSTVAIGGVRSWTLKEYRTQYLHGDFIIPAQIEWAKERGLKEFWLTFNDYNNRLRNFILRGAAGKGTAFGLAFSETYKDFEEVEGTVLIKNTDQFVLRKRINTEQQEIKTSV